MKVLVGYMSQTGNTKKVAEAIYSQIQADKEIKSLDEIKSLEGYDLAFIGFPVQGFGPAGNAKVFLEQHSAGKKLVLFVTHAVPEGYEELAGWLDKCKQAAAAGNVVGLFDCQGELSEAIAEVLKKSDDPKVVGFGNMRPGTMGQPDEARLERARAFAREVMAK
ncbi:MAG: flavodoxin family protein [Chloroflexota bacterium]|nr:flavodoxin family protein [Chloroflexota bacterium]